MLLGHGPVKLIWEGCCAAELLSADGLLYLPTVARTVVSHPKGWLRERDGLHGVLLRVIKLNRLIWLEDDALVAVRADDLRVGNLLYLVDHLDVAVVVDVALFEFSRINLI